MTAHAVNKIWNEDRLHMIIDFEAHAQIKECAYAKAAATGQEPESYTAIYDFDDVRLGIMDKNGIGLQMLSYPGPIHALPPEESARFTVMENNNSYEAEKRRPGRFKGYAMVPVNNVEFALKELKRAGNELGLAGWWVRSSYGNLNIDNDELIPLVYLAAELGMHIYLHPGQPAWERFKGCGPLIESAFGFHVDPALTLLRLITKGVLDKCPDLKIILDSCVKGANAANRQSYSIIVVRGMDRVAKVTGCFKAPVALVFCADYNRVYKVGERLGHPVDYDSIFYYLTAHTDAVIAAQTAVMTASSLGIGNLFTNSIHNLPRKDIAELCQQLEIPEEHCFPVTAVLLGYEAGGTHPKAGKLTGKGIIHFDKYTKLSDSEADDIISEVNNPNNHFGDAGGCKNFLEFFYTKRDVPRPREAAEKVDKALLAKLKSFLKY